MKGATMGLEAVVKWIILIAVAAVVVNLIVFFSDEIKGYIYGFMDNENFEPVVIEVNSFSTSQFMTYIRACWDRTGERFDRDAVCYILKGDMNDVDKSVIQSSLEDISVDVSRFDKYKGIAVIRFENIGNKIVVES